MKCFMCKGELKEATTSVISEYSGRYIVIKNVPCNRCTQCGEEYLNGRSAQGIEQMAGRYRNNYTEMALVDYAKAA